MTKLDRGRIRTIISEQREIEQNRDGGQTYEEVYSTWLEKLAKDPNSVWPMLHVPDELPTLGQTEAQLTAGSSC